MTMKAFKPKQIIKASLLIAAGLLALFVIPVPSMQYPHARMPLNDIVNRLSAQVASAGFLGAAIGEQAESRVDGASLATKICNESIGQLRIEKLTFEFDNIFALGIRILAFAIAFIVIYRWQAVGWRRILLAVVGGFVMLPFLILVRDFLFGVLLTQISAAAITKWFDNPFRILIMFLTQLTPLVICDYKGEKPGERMNTRPFLSTPAIAICLILACAGCVKGDVNINVGNNNPNVEFIIYCSLFTAISFKIQRRDG